VFGTLAGKARQLDAITAALRALCTDDRSVRVLYVGPDGALLQDAIPDLPVLDAGRLPAADVSVHLAAMDLHLTPFVDGLSTRRGSAMAGLQHGVATLSTDGALTDRMLRAAAGKAFVLTPVGDTPAFVQAALALRAEGSRRMHIAETGRRFFQTHFAWEAIADRVVQTLMPSTATLPVRSEEVIAAQGLP
jgi:glycosyltransferase involved in cell wall biosynthesis